MFLVTEDFKTFIKNYRITTAMVGICLLFMILTTVFGGYNALNVLRFGGLQHDLIEQGEVWRILSYAFMHNSYQHFFLNMTFLIILGRPLEKALGSIKFLIVYLSSAVFTGIVIYLVYTSSTISSGSSGVGYGFLGMYLYIIVFQKQLLSLNDRKFIVTFLAIGLISSFIVPSTSLIGHLAGLIGGIIISPFLLNKRTTFQSYLNA